MAFPIRIAAQLYIYCEAVEGFGLREWDVRTSEVYREAATLLNDATRIKSA